jgi:hypothetical protein
VEKLCNTQIVELILIVNGYVLKLHKILFVVCPHAINLLLFTSMLIVFQRNDGGSVSIMYDIQYNGQTRLPLGNPPASTSELLIQTLNDVS